LHAAPAGLTKTWKSMDLNGTYFASDGFEFQHRNGRQ